MLDDRRICKQRDLFRLRKLICWFPNHETHTEFSPRQNDCSTYADGWTFVCCSRLHQKHYWVLSVLDSNRIYQRRNTNYSRYIPVQPHSKQYYRKSKQYFLHIQHCQSGSTSHHFRDAVLFCIQQYHLQLYNLWRIYPCIRNSAFSCVTAIADNENQNKIKEATSLQPLLLRLNCIS